MKAFIDDQGILRVESQTADELAKLRQFGDAGFKHGLRQAVITNTSGDKASITIAITARTPEHEIESAG